MNYSISIIEEILRSKKLSTEINETIEILFSALNDWPININNLYDYELAVQNFIMNTTTKKNIEFTLSMINISKYAWEAESLSSLLEIYDYFEDGVSLKKIIDEISYALDRV